MCGTSLYQQERRLRLAARETCTLTSLLTPPQFRTVTLRLIVSMHLRLSILEGASVSDVHYLPVLLHGTNWPHLLL